MLLCIFFLDEATSAGVDRDQVIGAIRQMLWTLEILVNSMKNWQFITVVRRLRGGCRPKASTSTMVGKPSRQASPSPSRAPERSTEAIAAPVPNEEGDDVGTDDIDPSAGISVTQSVPDAPPLPLVQSPNRTPFSPVQGFWLRWRNCAPP